MPPALPSRRAVLHGLVGVTALAVLPGCSGDDEPDAPGARGGEPDPDLALLARALADKQGLLAAYEATLGRHRTLAARLEPMRADHAAHLAALTDFRPDVPAAAPSASASPGAGATPADRDDAVEALATAELAAAGRRIGQCRDARDPQLARLLAAVGGCEAAHTAILRAGTS